MEEMKLILGKSEGEFNKMKARVKKVFCAIESLMPADKKVKKVCIQFKQNFSYIYSPERIFNS